jgi:hypothetical protein
MENKYWNIVGNNKVHVKFTVPLKARKKWWEFWKKDEPQIGLKELMSKMNDDVNMVEGEYFLPLDNTIEIGDKVKITSFVGNPIGEVYFITGDSYWVDLGKFGKMEFSKFELEVIVE